MQAQGIGELNYCVKETVNVNLDDRAPNCYHNHFSVKINGTWKAVSAFARVIKDVSNLLPVNCNQHPVYIRTEEGSFIGKKVLDMQ